MESNVNQPSAGICGNTAMCISAIDVLSSSNSRKEHKVCPRASAIAPMLEDHKVLEKHDDGMHILSVGEADNISNENKEDKLKMVEESMKHLQDQLNLVVSNEVATGNAGNPLDDACIAEKLKGLDKIMHSSDVSDAHASSLKARVNDGTDDSDVEEQDVKVCDICGDAGREDLLAICCRCADGAEHTYCMREMLDKVPEGDWLCEECKSEDEIENQKQGKTSRAAVNENRYSSRQKTIIDFDHHGKAEAKASDCVGVKDAKECSYAKVFSRRNMCDSETISVAKKHAPEPLLRSPKAESPKRVPMLSRESSFRNLEKGKVKPVHQVGVVNDSCASGFRMQTSRGTFSKSNSFSSVIAKPRIKLREEVFSGKPKLMRETAFIDSKEGAVRSMNKSVSFKPSTTSRSNNIELKGKTISPKFSLDQDIKWPRHKKERSSYERKNSLRSNWLAGGTLSSLKNDNKPARRGEAWKQASSVDGVSVMNRDSSFEENPCQAIPKEDSSSSSCVAERLPLSSNEVLSDGLPQSKGSTTFGDKARECSASQSKQNRTHSGKAVSCQKCKGNGHLGQFCTVNGSDSPALDSPVKNSREDTKGPSDLKAAIEAAMLRKPGICRKSRVTAQSEDISASNMKSELPAQDQVLSSTVRRNGNVAHKQESTKNAKQFGLLAEDPVRIRDAGKQSLIDMERQTLASMPVLLKTAIPEYQCIWHGGFEVRESGNGFCRYEGIQAHLSSCASPMVLDTVNKFPRKVILNEVSRLSSWPIQFQERGVSEDNIAIFFFAKDIVSYEKSYKVLLGNMVKQDLALQGKVEGIELLIFPSNQLPEKFKRWNMMLFLWGVFRGKKANAPSLQHFPGAEKPISRNIAMATTFPENIFSTVPKVNSACGSAACNTEMPIIESESTTSRRSVNGNCSTQLSTQVKAPEIFSCPNMSGPMSAQEASPLDREKLSLLSAETSTSMPEVTSVGSMAKDLSSKDDVKLEGMRLNNASSEDGAILARHEHALHVNHKKRSHSAETEQQSASSSGTSHHFPIYIDDENLVEERCSKRWKPILDRSYERDNDPTSFSKDGFLSEMNSTTPQENERGGAQSKTAILEHMGNSEMSFIPVDPCSEDDVGSNNSSIPWKVRPLKEDQPCDKTPNLELALGAETKPLMHGIPSFISGRVGKKILQENSSDYEATSFSEDGVSAALSLSLSFPFPEKEQGSLVSKAEQEIPERRQVNTSFLLFGGPEKDKQ
ncbi:unnamed protein product [Cuscuta campestris]|uniref:AIPP2-like SPOC-like domain-containing protein n=1 Tax=Cuscuta campestris TaxID=132261 RepID=A0A484NKZ9_9ASTE|nr:unnamed protein product [Cuscuta campestris]